MTIKKMNLLPIEYQNEFKVDVLSFVQKAVLVIALISLCCIMGLGYLQLQAMNKDVAELGNQREQLLAQLTRINALSNEIAFIDQQLKESGIITQYQLQFSEAVQDIRNVTPPDTWYSEITIFADSEVVVSAEESNGELDDSESTLALVEQPIYLTIKGYSQSVSSIGSLVVSLNQVSYLKNCQVQSSYDIEVEGLYLVEFLIIGQITP